MSCGGGYPDDLDEREALKMLVAMVDRLKIEMSWPENPHGKWDQGYPLFYYLNRNNEWAKEVLARETRASAKSACNP